MTISNGSQVNLAFYSGMRLKWKERYINAGKSIQHDNQQSLLRYFQNQHVAAERANTLEMKKHRNRMTSAKPKPHHHA
jgi:predicted DNA-binding WGR domain protein